MDVYSLLERLFPSSGGESNGPPWIVMGLGNPGHEYRNNRHNVGWWCLDELVRRTGAQLDGKSKEAIFAEAELVGANVILTYPRTFMNRSGSALTYLVTRFETPPENILVVTDDINLAPGSIRIRKKGGAGGHNGLKSIISTLGTNEFPRVRIGVGSPDSPEKAVEHVLGTFKPQTRNLITAATDRAADAAAMIVAGDIDNSMNRFNINGIGNSLVEK